MKDPRLSFLKGQFAGGNHSENIRTRAAAPIGVGEALKKPSAKRLSKSFFFVLR
jgi:hypothetical protein